jgi:hypothetical protein
MIVGGVAPLRPLLGDRFAEEVAQTIVQS